MVEHHAREAKVIEDGQVVLEKIDVLKRLFYRLCDLLLTIFI